MPKRTEPSEENGQHGVEEGEKLNDASSMLDGNHEKNKRKRRRKKRKKPVVIRREPATTDTDTTAPPAAKPLDVEVEYVSGVDQMLGDGEVDDPRVEELRQIMGRFTAPEQLTTEAEGADTAEGEKEGERRKRKRREEDVDLSSSDDDDEEEEESGDEEMDGEEESMQRLSKKKLRKMKQMDVSELKQTAKRPDVVELHDVTAQDPKLLVYLKSQRNTVPVPGHWSLKRRYLQYKRGTEKATFELPEFIQRTGIQSIRESYLEREAKKSSKQKMRKWARPSMGKMDVDYAILHDAFFKYQTKPKLSILGDTYHEGKENEVRMSHLKPGFLSNDLRQALGMPDNGVDPTVPPPWLINMQRCGPPPSYPTLKIPGLNAQIPEGAQWGFQPGNWGRPPMDELGNPLYGNVYNEDEDSGAYAKYEEEIERKRWGEPEKVVEEEEEEEEEEESESEEEEEEEEEEETAVDRATLESGISSVASTSGYATPDVVRLRKGGAAAAAAAVPRPPQQQPHHEKRELFQVLEEKQTPGSLTGSKDIMGSSYRYAMPRANTVEATFDPAELEALEKDPSLLKDKYDVLHRKKQGGRYDDEDEDKPKKKKFKF